MDENRVVPSALQTIRDEHQALADLLRALDALVARGPQGDAAAFFEALRAGLFFIDEFPERLHHPRESHHLFPKLARLAPSAVALIDRLENDHRSGQRRVRELQHLLTGWELLGEARRDPFVTALGDYVRWHLAHLELEETELLALAQQVLTAADWDELQRVFAAAADPAADGVSGDPLYDSLFRRIAQQALAPAPAGQR